MSRDNCPECNGAGYTVHVRPVHAAGCTDTRCAPNCPEPEQYQEPCAMCGGSGEVETEES